MSVQTQDIDNTASLLSWHIAMGADEAIELESVDRFSNIVPSVAAPIADVSVQPSLKPTPIKARPAQATSGAGVEAAQKAASACKTQAELKAALEAFDGGLLKRSAKNTVFSDGVWTAPVMVIGDVPTRDDDQEGIPFSGEAGQMLDKMLGAIGVSRKNNAYLSTVLPWRPLGNRKPDADLLSIYRPFVERHIALAMPKLVLAVGGAFGKTVFETQDSISRQRGRWKDLSLAGQNIAAIATYHPTYLISQPHLKGAAWQDLQAVKEKLSF